MIATQSFRTPPPFLACVAGDGAVQEGVFPLPPRVQANVERVQAIWAEARTAFGAAASGPAAGPFLFGAFTAVDAMFAPVVFRFRTYNVPVEDPVVAAYMAAMLADEHVAQWHAAALAETEVIDKYDALSVKVGPPPPPCVAPCVVCVWLRCVLTVRSLCGCWLVCCAYMWRLFCCPFVYFVLLCDMRACVPRCRCTSLRVG
jgi:hypothetical protein